MKIKDSFILRNVAGSHVVLPMGASSEKFSGMLKLNETGVFLWENLKKEISEDDLINAMLSEYNVGADRAREDVKEFLNTLRSAGVLEE